MVYAFGCCNFAIAVDWWLLDIGVGWVIVYLCLVLLGCWLVIVCGSRARVVLACVVLFGLLFSVVYSCVLFIAGVCFLMWVFCGSVGVVLLF